MASPVFCEGFLKLSTQLKVEKGEMMEKELFLIDKSNCDHAKERHYVQNRLDILNGFELVLTRCINCHKVLFVEAKKIADSKA